MLNSMVGEFDETRRTTGKLWKPNDASNEARSLFYTRNDRWLLYVLELPLTARLAIVRGRLFGNTVDVTGALCSANIVLREKNKKVKIFFFFFCV